MNDKEITKVRSQENMKISEIAGLIHATIVCDSQHERTVSKAFASDLMSDVLTLEAEIGRAHV